MKNITLETSEHSAIDPDVLASAVFNVRRYFRCIQELSINFHLDEEKPLRRETVRCITSSLCELEKGLAKTKRLLVRGLERDKEFEKFWERKRRRFAGERWGR